MLPNITYMHFTPQPPSPGSVRIPPRSSRGLQAIVTRIPTVERTTIKSAAQTPVASNAAQSPNKQVSGIFKRKWRNSVEKSHLAATQSNCLSNRKNVLRVCLFDSAGFIDKDRKIFKPLYEPNG